MYHQTGNQSVEVNVYLYCSASLEIKIGSSTVNVTQNSDWPHKGDTDFSISSEDIAVTMRVRIPQWAPSWKVCLIPVRLTAGLTANLTRLSQ